MNKQVVKLKINKYFDGSKKGFTISCIEYYFPKLNIILHNIVYFFIPHPIHLVYNIQSIESNSQKDLLLEISRAWIKYEKEKYLMNYSNSFPKI